MAMALWQCKVQLVDPGHAIGGFVWRWHSDSARSSPFSSRFETQWKPKGKQAKTKQTQARCPRHRTRCPRPRALHHRAMAVEPRPSTLQPRARIRYRTPGPGFSIPDPVPWTLDPVLRFGANPSFNSRPRSPKQAAALKNSGNQRGSKQKQSKHKLEQQPPLSKTSRDIENQWTPKGKQAKTKQTQA